MDFQAVIWLQIQSSVLSAELGEITVLMNGQHPSQQKFFDLLGECMLFMHTPLRDSLCMVCPSQFVEGGGVSFRDSWRGESIVPGDVSSP
jgi:hypothetical protein